MQIFDVSMRIAKTPFSKAGLGKSEGCELAPDKIIKQAKEIFLSEEGKRPDFRIDKVNVDNSNITETNKNIFDYVMQQDEPLILLGGDHSITYSAFKAFAQKFKNSGLVIFDAHPDCENYFKPPTHEDFVNVLIKDKVISKNNIIIIGIRNWDKNEYNFLKNNKIKHFTMKEIFEEGVREICDGVMSVARNFGALYISIDIDIVDPAFAPGTGYTEPGGLTSRELLYFLSRLKKLNNLKTIDIVEINPKKDINNITSKLGAKILVEMMK